MIIDPQLIKGALLNLLVNAIQAMPDGGSLTLTIERDQETATLVITDTGIGISPENQKKIIFTFFTTKPKEMDLGFRSL